MNNLLKVNFYYYRIQNIQYNYLMLKMYQYQIEKVRQDFLDAVNPILDAIRRDRGLYDFRVTVSSDTADLDRNQMTGKIYIKPTRSLEFIDITFYITPTGASFENI